MKLEYIFLPIIYIFKESDVIESAFVFLQNWERKRSI